VLAESWEGEDADTEADEIMPQRADLTPGTPKFEEQVRRAKTARAYRGASWRTDFDLWAPITFGGALPVTGGVVGQAELLAEGRVAVELTFSADGWTRAGVDDDRGTGRPRTLELTFDFARVGGRRRLGGRPLLTPRPGQLHRPPGCLLLAGLAHWPVHGTVPAMSSCTTTSPITT